MTAEGTSSIKAIDRQSVHRITSGQVVVDLQTAVKELVENSLDAGATSIEVRFKEYGLKSIEIVDNGSGILPEDYDSIGLKHHTSKLSSYEDLTSVLTFGFRGEALSSLCAMCDSVTVTTATVAEAPLGTVIELNREGVVTSRSAKVARQRGTTVMITGLFKPLIVRRKEFERNVKREYAKVLNLLNAYALVPCAQENKGVRLIVSNQDGTRKNVQIRTEGFASTRSSVSTLWGPKSLENLVDLNLEFDVETEKSAMRRQGLKDKLAAPPTNRVKVRGLISKFALGYGRTGTDRQFFFINGRPCAPSKVQKAFNEIYKSFNINQSPFIIADFILPTDSCDINVSPDKRTILLHSEGNLIQALKVALEDSFASSRGTFDLNDRSQPSRTKERSSQSQSDAGSQPTEQDDLAPDIESREQLSGSKARPDRQERDALRVLNKLASTSTPQPPQEGASNERPFFVSSRSPSPVRHDKEVESASLKGFTSSPIPTPSCLNDLSQSSHVPSEPRSSPKPNEVPLRTDVTLLPSTTTEMADPGMNVDNEIHAHSPTRQDVLKRKEPPKQTVLDTSGAIWNLRRQDSNEPTERPSKKPRVADETDELDEEQQQPAANRKKERKEARQKKKAGLWAFAMPGSQAAAGRTACENEDSEDDDDDDDSSMEMEVDPKPVSRSKVSKAQVGPKSSTMDDSEEADELAADADDSSMPETRNGDGAMEMDEVDQASALQQVSPPPSPRMASMLKPKTLSPKKAGSAVPNRKTRGLVPDDVERTDIFPSPGENQVSYHNEFFRSTFQERTILDIDLPKLIETWKLLGQRSSAASKRPVIAEPLQSVTFVDDDAGFHNADDETATRALARVIEKDDFRSMDIVGQFNKGFIIARRQRLRPDDDDNGSLDDLFIVDQHAADEKFNFETLQQSFKFQSQKLVNPQPLELSAAEEMLAIQNVDILEQNGFEIQINNNDDRDLKLPRLHLVGRAIDKSTVFDMKDLEELLHLLEDHPRGKMVRCSKTRAMLAMRACRKSIMVGSPLNPKQMSSVVRHMSTMDQPWNCPHGRPTMRHLCDLSCVRIRDPPAVDWESYCLSMSPDNKSG